MLEIRKHLESLLIFNNEIISLQGQEEQEYQNWQKQQNVKTESSAEQRSKLRNKKAQEKEQDQFLKIIPNLMEKIKEQMPTDTSNSVELNNLLAEQTHLSILVNLFTEINEIPSYEHLEHFMTISDTLTFELNILLSQVTESKKTLLRSTRKRHQSQSNFYRRRLETYYESIDHWTEVIKKIQKQLVEKNKQISSRIQSLYL